MFPLPPYPVFNELASGIIFICCLFATVPGFLWFRGHNPRKLHAIVLAICAAIPPIMLLHWFPWVQITSQPIQSCWFYPHLMLIASFVLEYAWSKRRDRMTAEAQARRNSPHRSG
ncbi:hypothetical protein HN358_03910 [Candidatus Uhrbacteria bacterium]|jgi:hypothetical protein|nr:hypothetical protein [Candidatus Uhrbacteria bacterium]MBT7716923.1 hypothetical protein [Candidatus Uhrbacteria bacterium]